jgi:putative endonuclease
MRNVSREMEPSLMREEKQPSVYILANRYRGTIYVGVTSNLYDRVVAHKTGASGGFTAKYGLKTLVWYEHHPDMTSAILRETRLKVWKRAWKIDLIESFNKDWLDLHEVIEHRPMPEAKLGSISRCARME